MAKNKRSILEFLTHNILVTPVITSFTAVQADSIVPGRSVAAAGLTSSTRRFWMSLCDNIRDF